MKVKLMQAGATLPTYGTPGAACFDLSASHGADIAPRSAEEFGTGLAFEVPEGHALLVFSRSGHGFKKALRLANCVGVIDSDYRGEVRVKLHNDGHTRQHITAGDRIAQAMLVAVPKVTFDAVQELDTTARGEGGFGSTGAQ